MNKKQAAAAAHNWQKAVSRAPAASDILSAAVAAHEAGRLGEAASLYAQVLEAEPRNPQANLLMGYALLHSGDLKAAESWAWHARELLPELTDTHLLLGAVLRAQGRPEDSLGAFSAAAQLSPARIDVLLEFGAALAGVERWQDAATAYEAAATLAPDSVPALTNLGSALKRCGRQDEALDAFRRAVALAPDFAPAHYNLGAQLQVLERAAEAEAAYREAIRLAPDFAVAHNNLGNVLRQLDRADEAVASFERAIELEPDYAEAHCNLGNVHLDQCRYAEAAEFYARAIELKPALAEAYHNLGNALRELGRLDEAICAYETATRLMPGMSEAYLNLSNAFRDRGQLDRAMLLCRQAALAATSAGDEGDPALHYDMGLLLQQSGRLEEAVKSYRRAYADDPAMSAAGLAMGNCLKDLGRTEEASQAYLAVVDRAPDYGPAIYNLANALRDLGRIDEADAAFAQAVAVDPGYADAHTNRGATLLQQGRIGEANAAYRKAISLDPKCQVAHSNLLFAMRLSPDHSLKAIFEESTRWAKAHAPLTLERGNARAEPLNGRKLRVGYVSGDLRGHPVGYFMDPVLAAHDHEQFEVYCYANHNVHDELAERFKARSDAWREIVAMDDDEVAEQVERDGVDVLVDLSGHTAHNRLGIFARRPAPVQLTWLGYNATTGMNQMDGIICDQWLVPPEEEAYYSERPARLPHTIYSFGMLDEAPTRPVPTEGVWFGCFSTADRINERTARVWSEILRREPRAKLLLKARSFGSEQARKRTLDLFAPYGIDPDRIAFSGPVPRAEFLQEMGGVRVLLDPFPCNGGTTTVEALWMGVPVVTLHGDRFVGHVGESILMTAGMPELVAIDEEDYVAKALAIATDLPRLEQMRTGLRQQLKGTSLFDGEAFTRSLEELYMDQWRAACGRMAA